MTEKISKTQINNKQLSFGISFILLFINSFCFSQATFNPYTAKATGSAPTVVCIGDLNNDDKNDVVLCTGYGVDTDPLADNKSFVYLQNNTGSLSNPVVYSNSKFTAYAISICDVNNDSLNDLIIGYDDSIGVFYQNKTGTLNPIKSYYSGYFDIIDGLSTGDLNGDGLQDIAISHFGSSVISILYQKVSGGFLSKTYISPSLSSNHVIKVGDVTNDKRDDIVLSMAEGVFIYSQTTTGTLNPYVSNNNGNTTLDANGLAIGDINNDGIKDIVQSLSGANASSSIQLYLQNKTTNLIDIPNSLAAYQTAEPVIIADLNCDKKNEIIVAHGGTQKISIYEQTANIFSTYSSITIGTANHFNAYGMSVGDINNDGINDIVMADYIEGLVTIINNSNSKGTCCPKLAMLPKPSGNSAICSNGLTTKYTSIHSVDDSIIWNLYPSNAGNIIFSNNDSCKITWNDTWYGKAALSVKAFHTCGTRVSQPLVITVHQPTLNIGKDTIICSGYSISLKAKDGFDSYLWSNKSTDSLITVQSPSIQFVEAKNACGTLYDTITISAFPQKNINLPSDSILCTGKSMTFDVTLAGSKSYSWQDGSTNPKYTISKTGTFTINITDANNCISSKSINITSLSLPSITLPKDTTACDSISLQLSVQCNSCKYIWQNGNITSNILANKIGNYSVTASNVCGISKDSIKLQIIKSPILKQFNDTSICSGTSFLLNAGIIGKHFYKWQDGNSDSVISISKAGVYSLTVIDINHCKNNGSFTISELIKPKIVLPKDSTFCDTLHFPIDVSCQSCSYVWNDESTLPVQIITKAGLYSVTVSNICGSNADTIQISKTDCQSFLEIPTAFSPNDDNLNDILFAVGKSIENFKLQIFNRWGQMVFESNDLKNGWDGKQNGQQADEGVFMFQVTAKSINDGHIIQQNGTITLVR